MKIRKLSIALAAAALGVLALGAMPALGADHRDSPLTKDAPKSDIADLYVFKTPSGGVVYAMTVNPLTAPGDLGKMSLDPNTSYEFKFERTGDATPDASNKIFFSGTGPIQDFVVYNTRGTDPSDSVSSGPVGNFIIRGKTSAGSEVNIATQPNGTRWYVGPRDDPFFFDLAGLQNGLKFTGVDTFKGTNVTVIMVEVPAAQFVSNNVGNGLKLSVWATTSKQDVFGRWVQVDRMGRPAVNTLFIPAAKKDAYNNNTPDRDRAIYAADLKASLNALKSPAADTLTDFLLPDMMTFDYNKPTAYPNGRAPSDDVIDTSLQLITGDSKAGDGVNANDVPFLKDFPYFAPPNGSSAPLPPNTGNGLQIDRADLNWTMPIALVAAAMLLGAAGFVGRRQAEAEL